MLVVPEEVEVGVCHRGQGLHYCLGCAREPCQDDPSNQNSVVEIPAQSKESILICSAVSIFAKMPWSFNALSWPCLNCLTSVSSTYGCSLPEYDAVPALKGPS